MKLLRVGSALVLLIVLSMISSAATPVVSVIVSEYVSQTIAYDQIYGDDPSYVEATGELGENRTGESRTNITLSDIQINGVINITNVETIGFQTISSINITLLNTDNVSAYGILSKPAYVLLNSSVSLNNPSSQNVSFYLPELRAGDTVLINFTVNSTNYVEPLNFTEEYSFWRVLTGSSVNVTINVTHQFSRNVDIFDIEIYKIPELYDSLDSAYAFFAYSELGGEDAANAGISIDGLGRTILNWNASGGQMSQFETRQITFNATAPQNINFNWSETPNWATWMVMGNLSANFKLNGSITGLTLSNVTAISTAARLAVTKTRIDENNLWNSSINVSNDAVAPIDYRLDQLTIWATQYNQFTDPGNINTWINNTGIIAPVYGTLSGVYANATWRPKIVFSQGTDVDNYSLAFNYSLVPVVWATASFYVNDDGYQMFSLNETTTNPNNPYLFIEEIYVLLGGYLVKVTKELIPLEDPLKPNVYYVNVTLENIGTEITPELVTVFDLLPVDFDPLWYGTETYGGHRNMTSNFLNLLVTTRTGTWKAINYAGADTYILGASDSGEIVSGPYKGYWGFHIDLKSINATSDGNGIYSYSDPDKEVSFAYKIQGNQSLSRIENAYLVGVDPIRLEGANPSQSVASRLNLYSVSNEIFIFAITILSSMMLLIITILFVRKLEVNKK